jgi:hypothetical protein
LSAALQLPLLWAGQTRPVDGTSTVQPQLLATAVHHIQKRLPPKRAAQEAAEEAEPSARWAFYRRHTETLLRRYLYASMQVGRSPNLIGESVGRGWVSSRPVRTFEDALIFVLDVERCLGKLSLTDRQIVTRVCLQEYTQAETAVLLGMSTRSVCHRLPLAIDLLTESLVSADLMQLSD